MKMRQHKKAYIAERQYWKRYWRYRVFGEMFFPTQIITPGEPFTVNLSNIGKELEG